MASLKELRNRIASVQATQKITRAMQMVAASKLRRAQEAAEAARPYADRMGSVLANLAAGLTDTTSAPRLLAGTGSDQRHLLIVATAERGLCGGFNSSISRLARADAKRLMAEGKQVQILCVGRKGHDALKRSFENELLAPITYQGLKSIGFEQAQQVADQVLADFEADKFDICTLYFSRFENVISQIPTGLQIIPATIETSQADDLAGDLQGAAYDYEPEENEILDALLPRNISVQILRALLENAASEQGARMSAMDNATRNAGEMIDSLSITYNRSRQAQITKELIEIISGAEAL
ncbi:MAG: F0F1 ATP synthase subunit gamma [Rhodobiaceae bacterium]|mgnify:FL=1|jgi:F-type H+-transporting ATPase subunit gamma|nr:F0F1 ATP synthase subunit gamma [Rhodobiaceae bacterium]MBT7279863.1 F0F1 ATP synthase subunit gamma [Rhodobiaceae bacterium]MDG2496435.1 F0F1 ATP synthase subunit gamma [Alphaproteobacteria bacterium]